MNRSNKGEQETQVALLNKGFSVTKRGYPDFFFYKKEDGVFTFAFAEVKRNMDTLSTSQKLMISVMRAYGMPVHVSRKVKDLENMKLTSIDEETINQEYKKLRGL